MRTYGILIVALISFLHCFSQSPTLSPEASVSVLTFGPGTSLNDVFGHNAFRIKDTTNAIDVVFGYGGYDFNTPNFYLKFIKGKLNYRVTKNQFSDVYNFYTVYNRTIKEQTLDFTLNEKQRLFDYLENNFKPENREYLYDFFFDNCATKIRDITEYAVSGTLTYHTDSADNKTFRDLIYEHVDKNSWGSFGIDLALGSVNDRIATKREYMFLPKYIHSTLNAATLKNNEPVVKSSNTLHKKIDSGSSILGIIFSPIVVMLVLACFILFVTYKDSKQNKRSKWLDNSILITTSLIGIVLLLLWFATDHTAARYNYNLLWAFPLNFILIKQLSKKISKKWVNGYLKFLLLMLCLLTLHWILGVQIFALGLIPLLIALFIRYSYILKTMS